MLNNFDESFDYQAQDRHGWGHRTAPWSRRMDVHFRERHERRDDPRERRGHHGPRDRHEHSFREHRRGPFGHGGPSGPGHHHGPFEEGRRFFRRGDVQLVLLELLLERPMHGYEMMKALEEKSGGFYTPSAGTIYPRLQELEDRGFVTVNETEGKKAYSITDAGRAFLAEQQKEAENFAGPSWVHGFGGRAGFPNMAEIQALGSEAAQVARLSAIAVRSSFNDPEQLARIHAILDRVRQELIDLIGGTNGTPESNDETDTGVPSENEQA